MKVESFDSLEAAQQRLREAMEAADARVRPWQAAVGVGDCFVTDCGGEEGFLIFGEVLKGYREERLRHYRFCRCFSAACPEGEVGDVHVSAILCVISREVFELARLHGWDVDDGGQTEEGQRPPSARRTDDGEGGGRLGRVSPTTREKGFADPLGDGGLRHLRRAGVGFFKPLGGGGWALPRSVRQGSGSPGSNHPCSSLSSHILPFALRAGPAGPAFANCPTIVEQAAAEAGGEQGTASAAPCRVLVQAILRMRNADGSLRQKGSGGDCMKGTTSEGRTPCVWHGWAPAPQGQCPRRLPIVQIRGRLYYQDDRLQEFRALDAPWNRVPFEAVVWALAVLGKWPD